MAIVLKVQTWRPDTHPGYVLEVEWEYDVEGGRDTGREHQGVSVTYPDGTLVHRDTDGADAANALYQKIRDENVRKNIAHAMICSSLPLTMKKAVFDSDGDPVLDETGQQRVIVKDKHRPSFIHKGNGEYEFVVPGIQNSDYEELSSILAAEFGTNVTLRLPGF